MATAAVCTRFSQNAWRREMCSNCFRTKNEHPAAPVRQPVVLPSKHATPKQSILKSAGRPGRKAGSVCFHKTEAEVIGYDGGDAATDSDDENDTTAPAPVNGHDEPLYPEPSEEEEKAIQSLTRRNTDFNSENANLLKATPAPPVVKTEPPRAELGRKTTSAPIVCVTPFGAKPETPVTKNVISLNENKPKQEIVPQNTAKVTLNNELNLAKAQPNIKVTPRSKSTTEIIQNTKIIITNVNGTDKIPSINTNAPINPVVNSNVPPSPAVNINTQVTPITQPISNKAPETPQQTTEERERPSVPHTERRPPLGHESSSAPLSAPALVKLQVKDINDKPPAFLRHKDSVDLISPPASPRLNNKMISPPTSPKLAAKQEERPPPIGKVSSKLTVTLKSPTSPPAEVTGRRKLVEARSSALIRRWTVGERVLVQPRRPVLDAPEIVPLTLQSASKASSHLGLESRELAGEPDGEDAKTTIEPNPAITTKLEPKLATEHCLKGEVVGKIVPDNRVEDFIEIRVKSADQPPTPPSSPLPDEEIPVEKKDDTPPCLPASPPPTLQRPTSLPVVSPRTSFLHGALTGRPQVPAKPATLLASLPASAKRHATPVAVATPQLPTPPDTVKEEVKSEPKIRDVVPTPPTTPEVVTEVPIYDTPKNIEFSTPLTANKPPFSSGKTPKMGSYKKRQAPKPPSTPLTSETSVEVPAVTPPEVAISVEKTVRTSPVEISNKCHVRTASQESFEELSRRDSLTNLEKSPPNKKNNARFSLRRLLRLGVSRDERATSPESPNSSPSPPGSPPVRPEIIHPSMLDGRQVQVVSRIQGATQSPPSQLPAAVTPTGRPRPPPPPPRTLSLGSGRPSRPPPPQSVQLLQMKEKAQDSSDEMQDDDHAVYANLNSVQRRSPSKPQRTGSMRESSPECEQPASLTTEDSDYETVAFSDGRLSRRRRSAVMGSLEESYGAVVGANHRALAQLLTSLCAAPLPSQCSSTVLEKFASEEEGDETRGLVLLQLLAALKDITDNGVMASNIAEFTVLKPVDPQLSNIGPRLKYTPGEATSLSESPLDVGAKACRLLLPSEHKLPDIIKSAGLIEARNFLELRLWGPELTEKEREVALQRWLDLERATALQSLALFTTRLPLSQEMYTNFLVQASAVRLARAANL